MLRIGWMTVMTMLSLVAEPYVVITHPQSAIDTLSQSQVRMIYLKKRRFWNDIKLVALNLPPKHMLRQTFEEDILKMNHSQLDDYWIKEHYKGHRPPYRVESLKSMLLFVKKVKGAIGYIPVSKIDAGVKVIYESSL